MQEWRQQKIGEQLVAGFIKTKVLVDIELVFAMLQLWKGRWGCQNHEGNYGGVRIIAENSDV